MCEPVFELTIEGVLPNLNQYVAACKINRYAGGLMAKKAKNLIKCFVIQQKTVMYKGDNPPYIKGLVFTEKLDVKIEWIGKDKRIDPDNISFAKKFILDAFQEMKVLKNDGHNNINSFADTFAVDKAKPRVIVRFYLTPK